MLSFTQRSRVSSSGSIPKIDTTETAKDKEFYHMKTKADPTQALNEAQPATRNTTEVTTIQSIRNLEHRDAEGNVITDPDRSNPTRPRMERPLDTIRSFEAAIDGSYSRRASYRAETPNPMASQSNRRSGYFPGYQAQQRSNTDFTSGYYGNRMSNSRPDSYMDNYGPSQSQYGSNRRVNQRNQSDPMLYGYSNGQAVYTSHGHQQSYDTVGSTAYGSHGTDQGGNSTDPSSENSSIDRIQPPPKPDLGEVYGFNGFGGAPQFQGPILEEHGQGSPSYGQPGYGRMPAAAENGNLYQSTEDAPPPPPPPHKQTRPRVPIKLGATPIASRAPPTADAEKRKSWLKRRFSRNG